MYGLFCMSHQMPIFMQPFYLTQENVLANAFSLKLVQFPTERKYFLFLFLFTSVVNFSLITVVKD